MKTVLLFIMALAFSLNIMAEGSKLGQVDGCGGDALKGCKCITDSIAEKEVINGAGDTEDSGSNKEATAK